MSLEETKQLLRTHRIFPNKLLGQNFMIEPMLYPKLCTYAALSKADVVLDVGAGFGWLTRFLADKSKGVVAVEKDPQVAIILREQVKGLDNVIVVEGDVLRTITTHLQQNHSHSTLLFVIPVNHVAFGAKS